MVRFPAESRFSIINSFVAPAETIVLLAFDLGSMISLFASVGSDIVQLANGCFCAVVWLCQSLLEAVEQYNQSSSA